MVTVPFEGSSLTRVIYGVLIVTCSLYLPGAMWIVTREPSPLGLSEAALLTACWIVLKLLDFPEYLT